MTKKQLKQMGVDPDDFEVILDDLDILDETKDIDENEDEEEEL